MLFFFELLDANGERVFQPAFWRKGGQECPRSVTLTHLSFSFYDCKRAHGDEATAQGGIVPRWLSGFLSSDGCHMALGDISIAEVMFFGFSLDHMAEEVGDFGIGGAGADDAEQVEFEVTAEAWAQFPVAGQA